MPDLDAISTALATRYGLVSAPSGQASVRVSTSSLPQTVTMLPAILVFPDEGAFEYGASTRQAESRFKVQFLYSQGLDMARDSVGLRKWVQVLVDQLKGAAQLGGTVAAARVASWRTAKVTYAGEDFHGIELDVDVITTEPWSATS